MIPIRSPRLALAAAALAAMSLSAPGPAAAQVAPGRDLRAVEAVMLQVVGQGGPAEAPGGGIPAECLATGRRMALVEQRVGAALSGAGLDVVAYRRAVERSAEAQRIVAAFREAEAEARRQRRERTANPASSGAAPPPDLPRADRAVADAEWDLRRFWSMPRFELRVIAVPTGDPRRCAAAVLAQVSGFAESRPRLAATQEPVAAPVLVWSMPPRTVLSDPEGFPEAVARRAETLARHFVAAWSDQNP